jgi:hypothetical protein
MRRDVQPGGGRATDYQKIGKTVITGSTMTVEIVITTVTALTVGIITD